MKFNAFENNCARRVSRISWTDKGTNCLGMGISNENSELLQSVKTRKLENFGHITKHESLSIENVVINDLFPGNSNRARPATAWINNISDWTRLGGTQLVQATKDQQQ